MTISFDGGITGGTQTGLTSPTYTSVADTSAPNPRMKQHAVTALGGTQTGVRTSTVGDPFLYHWLPPVALKGVPAANPVTGKYPTVPFNVHQLYIRKGMLFASGQPAIPGWCDVKFGIPAGAESADAPNVRAMVSLLVGLLNEISSGLGDTLVTGIP
jgi:hypothetical protein